AEEALARVVELIKHFPFVPDEEPENWMPADDEGAKPSAHRSVWLSAGLTGLIRRFMRAAPLHAFDSVTAGTGKAVLIEAIAIIVTGRTPVTIIWVRAEDEQRKRIVTAALTGDQVLLFDNVKSPLGGATLEAFLTQPLIGDRLLTTNTQGQAPTNLLS